MEILPYFFLISGDSNMVTLLTDLTSHVACFSKEKSTILSFQKGSGFEIQFYVKHFRTNV